MIEEIVAGIISSAVGSTVGFAIFYRFFFPKITKSLAEDTIKTVMNMPEIQPYLKKGKQFLELIKDP